MTSPVITAPPTARLLDIVQILLENRISAVPIVDRRDRLVGLVSEGDLVRRTEIGTENRRSWFLSAFGSASVLAEEFVRSHGVTAEEIMTRKVITAKEDTPLREIAELLGGRKLKRVPVVRDRQVVGMVSRANLLQALLVQRQRRMEPPSREDSVIRDELMGYLRQEPWADISHVNVMVKDSIVHLWGSVRSESQRDALTVAAENIAGVREVVNHAHVSVALL
jgi:CBS domain-containing protein